MAAILNATTPLFTAIAAWLWTKESLGYSKILGLILGVFGVAVLVGWSPETIGREIYFSASLSLLAAVSYALAGIYSSRAIKGFKPFNAAVGQQISASILLFPFALYTLPQELPSMNVVFSVLGLALICTSFAYLLFFRLINNVGPIKTLTVTFLVPIFAVLWGTIFLGEHIYPNTIVGLVLIIVSIILVTNLLADYIQRKKYDILKRNLSND